MSKKQSKNKYLIRLAVQIFFLALIILISVNHFRSEQGLLTSIDRESFSPCSLSFRSGSNHLHLFY